MTQKTKQAAPLKPEYNGAFLSLFRRIVRGLSEANVRRASGLRIIGVHKNPRKVDVSLILRLSGVSDGRPAISWHKYDVPTRSNAVPLHEIAGNLT